MNERAEWREKGGNSGGGKCTRENVREKREKIKERGGIQGEMTGERMKKLLRFKRYFFHWSRRDSKTAHLDPLLCEKKIRTFY